jgi:hypothetical protein
MGRLTHYPKGQAHSGRSLRSLLPWTCIYDVGASAALLVNYPAAKDSGASDTTNNPSLMGLISGQSAIPLVPKVLILKPSLYILTLAFSSRLCEVQQIHTDSFSRLKQTRNFLLNSNYCPALFFPTAANLILPSNSRC